MFTTYLIYGTSEHVKKNLIKLITSQVCWRLPQCGGVQCVLLWLGPGKYSALIGCSYYNTDLWLASWRTSTTPTPPPSPGRWGSTSRVLVSIPSINPCFKIAPDADFSDKKKVLIHSHSWTFHQCSLLLVVLLSEYGGQLDRWEITSFVHLYCAVMDSLHLVGHSLGAHVMGAAAKEVKRLGLGKLRRLTALDPAYPFFESEDLYPWRVDKSDAELVQILHTNSGFLWEGCLSFKVAFWAKIKWNFPPHFNETICSSATRGSYWLLPCWRESPTRLHRRLRDRMSQHDHHRPPQGTLTNQRPVSRSRDGIIK